MEESWDFEFLSRMADSCVSFLSEFIEDWLANDMRVSIFKILLGWLILSLIAIHFAWKIYGNTVNDMYYRQGTGQNGGSPDAAPHLSGWQSAKDDVKTHRE
ncbi:T-cell leukemia translocation-altered gene protein homolog [Gadus morhua]|uniref:T-cell leukemia translocation-altered gene protein homolog n=2 Tax=Gadus TaxID=8048 RepID=A0A8C5F6M4_GADMO|nr:T-cell leukemia translocation-altered gene protein [Gadus morhua]XP_059925546.1 T-cell leukemia translocation-altered gene protein homolog [Gadus macrocephalus]